MPDVFTKTLKTLVERDSTQAQVARLCGVSRTAVWQWTQGRRPITLEATLTLSSHFGWDPRTFSGSVYAADRILTLWKQKANSETL